MLMYKSSTPPNLKRKKNAEGEKITARKTVMPILFFCYVLLSCHLQRFLNIVSWKRPTRIIEVQSPGSAQDNPSPHCVSETTEHFSNSVRLDAGTTSLERLFQCTATLLVKSLLLISNLNLP